MSATATTTKLARTAHKALKNSSIEALLNVTLPIVTFQDNAIVKASSIHLNADTASAGMGAKFTPTSFISGAIWHLAKAGHSKLEVSPNLPEAAQEFLKLSYASCGKSGNGFSAGTIRGAVRNTLAEMIARGPFVKVTAPATPAAPAIAAPATAPAAPAAPVATLSLAEIEQAIFACNPAMDNTTFESIQAQENKRDNAMSTARASADALEAIRAHEVEVQALAYRSLQATITAQSDLINSVAAAKTIKEVRTLLASYGVAA